MMLNRALLALVAAVSLAFQSQPATAAVLMDLYNTGVDNFGVPLPGSSDDPHYTVTKTSGLPLAGMTDIVAPNGFPIPPWVANDANSKWIGVSTNGMTLNQSPDPAVNGIYQYTTTFTVPANAILSSISISGLWATDNAGVDILINGVSTAQTAGGFGVLYAFLINDDFVHGVNTIDFIVRNLALATGNPTGLRVDNMVGDYTAAVPEATTVVVWSLVGLCGVGLVRSRRLWA